VNLTNLLTKDNRQGQQQQCCFAHAVVVQNDSSENPGMVKVQYSLLGDEKNVSKYIPCLSSSAGQGHGSYCCPEVGDQVIVGFMDNNQESPFVMGCLYPSGSDVTSEQFDSGNCKKSLKTKGGFECTIQDEDGKQYVEMKTASGSKLRIDDGSSYITISDKDNNNYLTLSMGKGDIEIVADKKITLKAGGAELVLSADAESISLSGAQITLESSRSLAVTSNNMLKVEGGIATVEGRQTLTLSGGMVRIS
jgi:uncharacterized protein involved in type VI secretion and phage assembly